MQIFITAVMENWYPERSSIGECEILGDIATQIDQIVIDSTLTDEEKRKARKQADNEVRKIQSCLNRRRRKSSLDCISEYTTTQEIHNTENRDCLRRVCRL